MLNETQYELTYTKCIGAAIDTIWRMLNPIHNSWTGFEGLGFEDFIKRREAFLWILQVLLKEGRIKLHRNGIFLESSIKDQINLFRKAWPSSIKASGYEDFYWWFFDPECPAGIAWRREDGSYEIAD
jgi:hypothetical protein